MARRLIGLHLAVSCALALSACGGASTAEDLEQLDPALFAATPTYETEVKALLEKYCVACHDSGGLRRGGVELDQYESAYSARIKNLCVSITAEMQTYFGLEQRCMKWRANWMPYGAKSRMTLAEQVLFARWVLTGGPR